MNFERVKRIGRTRIFGDVCFLGYTGSGVEFTTEATRVQVVLQGPAQSDALNDPYFRITVDDGFYRETRVQVRPGRSTLTVFESENAVKVKVTILRTSESHCAVAGIADIISDGEIYPTAVKDRKITFVGDSLTAGFGMDGVDGEEFNTRHEDCTRAFAWLTSKKLNCEASLFAFSGNGIISQWIPEDVDAPNDKNLMPAIFPYTDLLMDQTLGAEPEKWDTALEAPDLVVVNLGTNDNSYVRMKADRLEDFMEGARVFYDMLLEAYPEAEILIAYGLAETNMVLPERQVVETMGVERLKFLELPLQTKVNGYVTAGHPGPTAHETVAQFLASKIREMYPTLFCSN